MKIYDGKCQVPVCDKGGFFSRLFKMILCPEHHWGKMILLMMSVSGIIGTILFLI